MSSHRTDGVVWCSVCTLSLGTRLWSQVSEAGRGARPDFMVVKAAHHEEDIVVVVELKRPAENTPAGRRRVKEELAAYIEERFAATNFSTIYAIGGIGLSFVVYKMEKDGPPEPELVFRWSPNVTTAASFRKMARLASMVDQMTGTVRDE
ncbi:hypothetical protein EDC04DRAFT_2661638 [Pisolithus marmoratus]|nr:hypothetical protein EDC04DRAFT_2661638 [Pisolithus marmoratus]